MTDTSPWVLTDERRAYDGLITVLSRHFVRPDGEESRWDVLAPAEMVSVVAITTDGYFLVVEQFRAGPMRVLHELPGGYLEPEETPADAAARELREETGYAGGSYELLGSSWVAPDAAIRLYAVLARDCQREENPSGDADESGHVVRMTLQEFIAHARGGEFTDQATAYRALDALSLLR